MDDRGKTLEQIEGAEWGEQTFNSGLVIRCHESRKVPLANLTAEDLRLLIGQQMALEHLVLIALEVRTEDHWAEGDLYPGALMKAVIRVDSTFWKQYPAFWDKLVEVKTLARRNVPADEINDRREVLEELDRILGHD